MTKTPQLSVLTANRLADGIVVFLDFEGAWSESLGEALVARSLDEVKALEDRGAHDANHNLVVDPYLVEVREDGSRLTPIRYRERVRVLGPSILDDVPGYAVPSPSHPSLGESEGQPQAAEQAAAPHPSPLPASGEREILIRAA